MLVSWVVEVKYGCHHRWILGIWLGLHLVSVVRNTKGIFIVPAFHEALRCKVLSQSTEEPAFGPGQLRHLACVHFAQVHVSSIGNYTPLQLQYCNKLLRSILTWFSALTSYTTRQLKNKLSNKCYIVVVLQFPVWRFRMHSASSTTRT